MLEASGLECQRGERRIFSGVGLRLGTGQLVYLQGRNGSGKTSLLRMLCGLLPVHAGSISWNGEPIDRLGEDYRRQICFLGHHNAIKDELSPLENLLASSRLSGRALRESEAVNALGLLGLAGREDLACRYLSQGQKRRVALAKLVNEQSALWLLDEPFVALDAAAVDLVAHLIEGHLRRGGMAVLTTHQAVTIAAGTVHHLMLDSWGAPC